MAQPKILTGLRAVEFQEVDPQTRRSILKDAVSVYAQPTWLKGDMLARADLTPAQARALAIELLQSADRVERSIARRGEASQ